MVVLSCNNFSKLLDKLSNHFSGTSPSWMEGNVAEGDGDDDKEGKEQIICLMSPEQKYVHETNCLVHLLMLQILSSQIHILTNPLKSPNLFGCCHNSLLQINIL